MIEIGPQLANTLQCIAVFATFALIGTSIIRSAKEK